MPLLPKKKKVSPDKVSIGLDIGTYSVKFVKMKSNDEGAEILDFYVSDYSPEGKIPEDIKRLASGAALNLSVCGPATIIRYVTFPKMKEEELRAALKFEAQKHIPFSVAEVNMDMHILQQDPSGTGILVLLAAVKKDFLNQRLSAANEVGMKVDLVDMDPLALINAFLFNHPPKEEASGPKAVALLNIGASLSNLSILEGGIPRLSRDIHIAGSNFTGKIMDIFNVDFKTAEIIKASPDKEHVDKVNATVDSLLAGLSGELRTSFDYYESQGQSTITKIFLSGGSSLFGGIDGMLSNLLGIEVEYWNPVEGMGVAENVDTAKLKACSRQLAVAVGLALRK